MAPARKPKSVNKRFSTINDVTPEKDGRNLGKSSLRKKYSDKLGPQWSKEELGHFYEAYRKYGKDWKKVAAVVRNRSIDMVEALYTTNRAYLSLPEGTASVVGLVAMMTDYYNILEESDSERESNGASPSWKPLKHKRQKVQLNDSKDIFQSRSIASSDGYLSLLNRRNYDGTQPRAVRKRTPRFPVSFSHKKDIAETYASPSKRGRKLEVDTNEDKVARVAALTLAEASQRGGSPQISQTSYRRTEHITSSPAQSWERMHAQSDMTHAKLHDAAIDENWVVSSIRSRGAENGDNARDTSSLMDMEGVGTVEVHKQGRKSYRKEKVEDIGNNQYDDGCEACSGTEEGINFGSLQGKVDIEVSNTKSERFSVHGQRKRSKKLFLEDETTGFHALQTLADLSLSTMESESSVQLKEERIIFDMDYKSSAPEATSTSHHEDKNILSRAKEKAVNAISRVDGTTSKMSKLVRDSSVDVIVTSEAKEQLQPVDKTLKRKRKPMISKVLAEEENKSAVKAKRSGQSFTSSKQWKLSEASLDIIDHRRVEADLAVSAEQIPVANHVSLSTKRQRRRKMSLPRSSTAKETKSYEIFLKNRLKYSTSSHDKALLKEKLSCYLSSRMVRRWCTFEWFYSAIEYPWFAKREFVEYLNHVGLGHIPRLTRVEWGVIRSSLGKPRRFSEHFLHEEREKLRQYRESVRKHYNELRAGIREGLPTDLARPLSVGQRVIALHPKTRELYDGSVLTVDHDKCRVQFDSPEIGVEFVMDIDCMPLNPLDNMPEALKRQNFATGKFSLLSKEPQINGHLSFEGSMMIASSGHMERVSSPVNSMLKQGKVAANRAVSQAKAAAIDVIQVSNSQPCMLAQNQAREADIIALSEMNRALDRKEALLMELRSTNNDVVEKQNNGDCSLKDSEPFKKHYAMVLVQLKEASGQVSSALLDLRQRNTYPGNTLPPWMKLPTNSNVHCGLTSSDNSSISQESASSIVEIVKGSRLKAHTMVDAAIQAFTLRKEGEDAFVRIGQALDSIDNQQLTSDSRVPVIRCQQQDNGSLGNHSQMAFYTSESLVTSDASFKRLGNDSDEIEAQIPSELITSCVAALLMIQTCTERQYPPADVAQILDSALTSLHPCCPQNLPIYREIQMCVGRIKTQILALIPT
ncbi:protein ALWAYS EARLY 2 isoform X2 [Juglans microcarpa x Juglans regia]|uniref:protein ALWAYS EARLY 2 isoform X2 n=1 Tax=Juglans microcarpa x Juglans regia TaxID=2249226 RepID=UPI001B7DA50C|nr:protein ALWAYS EARLY 2 isoform X2 [Juglans microcarpa x Juglans regia]